MKDSTGHGCIEDAVDGYVGDEHFYSMSFMIGGFMMHVDGFTSLLFPGVHVAGALVCMCNKNQKRVTLVISKCAFVHQAAAELGLGYRMDDCEWDHC